MKYLHFNESNECCGVFDNAAPGLVAYDLDDSREWSSCLVLVDGVVTNPYAGVPRSGQEAAFNQAKEQANFEHIKSTKIPQIKMWTADALSKTEWRVERAREQDLLDNTTTRTQAILQLRQDIRDAGNAHEATLAAITTMEQLEAFNPREIPPLA